MYIHTIEPLDMSVLLHSHYSCYCDSVNLRYAPDVKPINALMRVNLPHGPGETGCVSFSHSSFTLTHLIRMWRLVPNERQCSLEWPDIEYTSHSYRHPWHCNREWPSHCIGSHEVKGNNTIQKVWEMRMSWKEQMDTEYRCWWYTCWYGSIVFIALLIGRGR